MLNEFISADTNVFHVHIPKTGGTSLNATFHHCEWFINGEHSFYEVNFPFYGKRTSDGRTLLIGLNHIIYMKEVVLRG